MNGAIPKAFILCEAITASAAGPGRKDLGGVGLSLIRAAGPYPIKYSFWVYLEMTNQKPQGILRLALMRADSGRRHFFREIAVQFPDPLHNMRIGVRLFNCVFPRSGVYFVEAWYDGEWLTDQRLEVHGNEGHE